MFNNPWIKLATVSLAGIVISFGILWGINQFNGINSNSSMNMGNNNQMSGMQMGQQGSMSGMNTQNGINVREKVNAGGMNVQESVNVNPGPQNGFYQNGPMQFGFNMMNRMRSNTPAGGMYFNNNTSGNTRGMGRR